MLIVYDQKQRDPLSSLTFDEFVGAIVSSCRVDAKMSQLSLASAMEITLRQVKEIEAGSCRPSAALMVGILKRFNMSLSELVEEYAYLFSGSRYTQIYGNVIFLSKK
ncbi:MAG: hypothetical protein TECD_00456 [Hyphomicrobiaceae bacterium hypho_1]